VKVVAALSGGVDSAVAAARARDAGHDVVAVHLALSENPQSFRSGARGCCSLEDSRDARRVADVLDLPFYVWDLAERFTAEVVDDFVAEYARGRTPNPCLRCNERIKFSAVLHRALALGFDAVCTGHYARLVDGPEGRALHRAVDHGKDQSYVLGVLTPEQLDHAMFPVGDSTKEQVRVEAADRGLLVADKPDSHDICFIADGDTQRFLAARLGDRPGSVVDEAGHELGRHDGAYGFTIGQRRGLGLSRPAVDGRPRYVLDIEPITSTVVVGSPERLAVGQVVGGPPTWCGAAPPASFRCDVQVRAHGAVVPATAHVVADGRRVMLRLHEPAHAVAAGQAAVMYDGSRVVGSVTIDATAPWPTAEPAPSVAEHAAG
jgi:tRNA-uridine 2-sulfurtransferase